ncbi:hypothetical protein [Merismopedia glauca]|uniref:Uncharacterized protein n=1 Tax=Merismopedia glauca CCAP 1448/3 TaxID=1296344 RepID=A0A2T1C3E5_9CYAN|nr:hypothetical protein [Merismopedia glauca]PSB02795.1 hypothetical protein C7B64_11625 [Merismopedia glauca CCAP 1448/3]
MEIPENASVVSTHQRSPNPFEKESFARYRDWSESLVNFMAEQAKNPHLLSWQQLITSEKALENACCCAIILASSIEYEYSSQSCKLRQIAAQLKAITTDELNTWLQSGWLDVTGLENSWHALLEF